MRFETRDHDAVAKYEAALAEERRLKALPDDERDEEAYRAATLVTLDAFTAIARDAKPVQ